MNGYTCTDWACGNWIEQFFGPQNVRHQLLSNSSNQEAINGSTNNTDNIVSVSGVDSTTSPIALISSPDSCISGISSPSASAETTNLVDDDIDKVSQQSFDDLYSSGSSQQRESSQQPSQREALSSGSVVTNTIGTKRSLAAVSSNNANSGREDSGSNSSSSSRKRSRRDHRTRGDPNLHNILEEYEVGYYHKPSTDNTADLHRSQQQVDQQLQTETTNSSGVGIGNGIAGGSSTHNTASSIAENGTSSRREREELDKANNSNKVSFAEWIEEQE